MAKTIFVPPFQDPQLRQFAQQVVDAILGSTSSVVTVGKGNPTNTMGVVPGDTYWNTTDNNFWIFNNNIWNVLETGLNESIFFGKTGYFIPPLLSGLWDTTVNTIITLNIVTLSGLVEVEFFVTADINGNLTVSQPDVPGLYISVIDQGTPSVQLITEHKVGRATTLIRAGQDIRLYSSNMAFDYRYLALRYADSITGTGISTSPNGKRYLGIDNNPTVGSTNNPADYTWYDLGLPLSAANRLWVKTGENRIALFQVAANQPDGALYNDLFSLGITTLDLDSRTGTIVQSLTDTGGSDRTIASSVNETGIIRLPATGPGAGNRVLTDVSSITIDDQGRIANFGAIEKLYVGFIAGLVTGTGPQTNVSIPFAHVVGQALIFLNGILLEPDTYTETTTEIVLLNCRGGDSYRFWRFTKSDITGTVMQIPFVRNTVDTVAGQATYSISYTRGADNLFYNGVYMNDPAYDNTVMNTITMKDAPTVSGKKLTMVSFNKLTFADPFNQFSQETVAGQTLYTARGTSGPTQYTALIQNGVAMTADDYTTTSTTADVAGTFTLTQAPYYSLNYITGISWKATGVATLSSGIGANTSRTLEVGMLLANGEKVKEVGEEDPSKNGLFTKVEPPKSIGEMFYELQEQVAALEAEVRQLRQGGNNGTRVSASTVRKQL